MNRLHYRYNIIDRVWNDPNDIKEAVFRKVWSHEKMTYNDLPFRRERFTHRIAVIIEQATR